MVSHEALPGVSMGIANRGWCGSFTILGDSKVITLYKNKIHCRCRKTGLAILYCPLRLNSPFGDMHELALTGQVVKESGASACHAHGWTGDKESQPRGFSYHGVWTTSSNITDYRAEAPGATPDRMTPACGGSCWDPSIGCGWVSWKRWGEMCLEISGEGGTTWGQEEPG